MNLLNAEEVMSMENKEAETAAAILKAEKDAFNHSIEGVVIKSFHTNRDERRYSKIEDNIRKSTDAYNGVYSQEDISRLDHEGGSQIFMNITATKCKVAKAWISDILLPAGEKAYSIEPTPLPSIPAELAAKIEESVQRDALNAPEKQPQQPQQGAQQAPVQGQVETAQESVKKTNKTRRDVKIAILDEIRKEAKFEVAMMETMVDDQLTEGDWDQALTDFITDITIYPNAFMKGPIITKKSKMTWKDGQPVIEDDYVFLNKRVSPWDIYPDPAASCVEDGNFIEHTRYTIKDIQALKGVPGYDEHSLNHVIRDPYHYSWLDTGIEQEKDDSELRSSYNEMNRDEIHGLHFFGSLTVKTIMEWPGANAELVSRIMTLKPEDVVDVEAILISNRVVKVSINDDPLGKRPYYTASYLKVPGSFWGRSLPSLMEDVQRMCNATSRALSNNLSISSGPQVEVKVDLLADAGEIEEMTPRKIWQTVSDPAGGASGKAINFFQPSSNAQELLLVYEKFETRADDVTGIPRYAYGNDKMAGAGTTVGGLSLLLESTSKIIKDTIRNIDIGLIKPRVECQFYYNLLKNPDLNFTGDINVVATGSSILTIRAAQRLRQNEFLQITANPVDQKLMGYSGRANILREIAKGMGLNDDIIPTPLELTKMEAEDKQAQTQAAKMEQEKIQADHQASLAATQIQIEGQKQMSQLTQQVKAMKSQSDADAKRIDQQLELMKINTQAATESMKGKSYENAAAISAANKKELAMNEMVFKAKVSPDQQGI